jgi:hypothetical protein
MAVGWQHRGERAMVPMSGTLLEGVTELNLRADLGRGDASFAARTGMSRSGRSTGGWPRCSDGIGNCQTVKVATAGRSGIGTGAFAPWPTIIMSRIESP